MKRYNSSMSELELQQDKIFKEDYNGEWVKFKDLETILRNVWIPKYLGNQFKELAEKIIATITSLEYYKDFSDKEYAEFIKDINTEPHDGR